MAEPNTAMQYSGKGLELTEKSEGCRLMPYLDSGGVPTNGFGNTHGVVLGVGITMEQAVADLKRNIQSAVAVVQKYVTVKLTQGEFDALVDFVFNEGVGNFLKSTLLKLLNAGDYEGAKNELPKWDEVHGQVLAGLLARRIAEQQEWDGVDGGEK